ncbi:M48 family metalloprotease [Stakelama saccharophila]|uniref:M48 family metalloprotease n=1 Tax=Stakelama saccharophila TaxID=3075605 RepID=A0ABZ0B679_9SPHN|nr:M48 family metalloprotease [Stakelama sp. W311]WNO52888.1 M48 family metalloprotease [Stakelama sp. W311]
MRIPRTLMLCAAPAALAGCTAGLGGTTPVVPGQAAPISQAERQQGTQARDDIIAEYGGVYENAQAQAIAERVGQRIAVQSGLSADPDTFTVTVLDSPVNNAFATPGGYVYVTRGLMALMNDEAELAAVLGHEVAHVAARHSQKRQQATQTNSVLGALGQVLAGAVLGNSALGQIGSQIAGTGAQLATLGYSRSQESQADRLAVQYLKSAGYDTDALASMLTSLADQQALDQRISGETRSVPEWASTHPNSSDRIRAAITEARQAGGTELARNPAPYLAAIDGILYGDNPAQGVIRGRDFLHPKLGIAFTVPQGFTMNNGAQAVTITGPNIQALFGTGSYSGSLDTYIGKVLQGLGTGASVPSGQVRRTTVNGIPAAYTQVRANTQQGQVDVTVFAYETSPNRAYHFVVLTPAGQGLGQATSLVESFRKLSQQEAAAIDAKRVDIVTVGSGQTVSSLAGRMAFDDYQQQRFLVLNGFPEGVTLKSGQKVKIVTE